MNEIERSYVITVAILAVLYAFVVYVLILN